MRPAQFEWYRGSILIGFRLKEIFGAIFLRPGNFEVNIMMKTNITGLEFKIHGMAARIAELREIEGYTVEETIGGL